MKRIAWIVLACLPLPTIAQAASFNCEKASTNVERTICGSEKLSAQDSKLQDEYAKALSQACNSDALKADQRNWLKFRNTREDENSLFSAYEMQLKMFLSKNAPPTVKNLVISQELGKYKLVIKQAGCREYRSFYKQLYSLTVFDQDEKPIQTIEIRSSSSQDQLLSIVDMDGDGYKDLSISLGYSAGPFPSTTLFRFNKDKNIFEQDKSFPGGSATPAKKTGCVYIEERISTGDPGYDYQITEWCLSPEANEWTEGKACSLLTDKKCYNNLSNYQRDWYKRHPVE